MVIKAVQQFQLGTVLNNEKQAMETMVAMKAAGYQGIELCSFMIHPTSFAVRALTRAAGMPTGNGGKLDWTRLIRESGLQVPSLHHYLNAIEDDPQAVAEEAASFGARYVTLTGMYRFDYSDSAQVHALAQRLNRANEALNACGVELLYHNHNIEFLKPEPNKTAYQILMEETNIGFEFDSYWAIDAGVDALALMHKLGDRLKLYHINDRGCRISGTPITPIMKMDSMELGNGTLDLDSLLNAALPYVDAVILESHRNWIDGSPVKSFQQSASFLNRYL
ncbi:MAG: sugar phosphate isomerase/epimerase [Oscillospiraceae bacterium]|nr:sugar phosphate isomerase/epimerase [Oscillospiraceae bacterium]